MPVDSTTDARFSLADFGMVVLVGLAGAFFAGGLGLAVGIGETGLLILTTVAMSGVQLLAVWLILRRRASTYESMGLTVVPGDGRFLGLGLLLQILLAVLAFPILESLDSTEQTTQAVVEQVSQATGGGTRIAVIVLVGFLAPLAEEVVFRGVLLQVLQRKMRPAIANVTTAAVFSVVHAIGLLPGSDLAGLVTLGLLFVVGLVLGALTIRHGRLGPAIFTHAGYNLTTLLLVYAAPQLA